MATRRKQLPPIHPGTILREDLRDVGISMNRLARDLRVPMNRISAIVNGRRAISADTAMRLAKYFGTSAQYWMNLQSAYDLAVAQQIAGLKIDREVLPLHAA